MLGRQTTSYKSFLIAALILIIAISVAFANSVNNPFLYDDNALIMQNYGISSYNNLAQIFNRNNYFNYFCERTYRPVTSLIYLVLMQTLGNVPSAWRLFNLTLHLGNCLLLYLIIKRFSVNEWLALSAVTLFAIHPVHTEIINVISFNEDIIGAFLCLLALYGYYRKGFGWQTASVILFFLSCLTKEIFILLPLLLLAFSWWEEGNSFRKIKFFISQLGFLFAALIYLYINFYLMKNPDVLQQASYPGGSLYSALLTFSVVIFYYLKIFFLPLGLTPVYDFPIFTSFFEWQAFSSVIGLALICGLIIYGLSRRRGFAPFLIWFFLFLLPTSNIIPYGGVLAERYLYLPYMGLIPALVLLVRWGLEKTGTDYQKSFLLLGVIFGIFFVTLTIKRNAVWADQEALWLDTIKKAPKDAVPHAEIAFFYYHQGQYEKAAYHFEETLRYNRLYENANYNLAKSYMALGQFQPAREHFERMLRKSRNFTNPGYYFELLDNLGTACFNTADYEAAYRYWKQAADVHPDYAEIYLSLTLVNEKLGRGEEAAKARQRYNELTSMTR